VASLFPTHAINQQQAANYAKRMSSHVAAALTVFAVLQIAVVASLHGSLLMHLGIFLSLGCFSVAARSLENRWAHLLQGRQHVGGARAQYRADLWLLWSLSLSAPFLWIAVALIGQHFFG
jgi:hypothetical protein